MAKDDTDNASRSSSLSKELDSNESFMKKVSSRVSDLIPTSLSKWFARDEDKSAVRYREEDDDLYSIQPPTKRVKMPTEPSFSYNHFSLNSTPTHHNNMLPKRRADNLAQTLNFAEPVAGPSGIKARKLSVSKTHQQGSSKEVLNGDKDTDSGDSTSGYSSMIKIGSKEQLLEKPEAARAKEPKTNSLFNNTPVKETNSRTLFHERSLTPQTNSSLSSRRPSFNASTFGSPTFVDRTLSTQRILNSPFYNGRTVYGGASAYGRKLGTTVNNSPLRNSVQVKPINEKVANDKSSLSLTARRILNTLEQYATPVSDAKKIPLPTKRHSQHDGIITKYTGVNPYSRALNKELQVPTIPDLLKLKEQLQESTVSVRQIATTSKSELNKKEYKIRMDEKESLKHSNKIKSKVSSLRQKAVDLEKPVDQVKLPNVALPISTLPKFDFSLPPPPSFVKPQTTQTPKKLEKASNTALSSKPAIETETIIMPKEKLKIPDMEYKFSNPLVIAENLKSIISINNFKFSEPILKKSTKVNSTSNFKSSDNTEFKIKRVTGRNNGETQPQPAPLLAVGSVMDILGKKSPKETVNLLDKFKPQVGSWECSVCLIRNQPDVTRCAACESQKTEPEPKSKEIISVSNSGFGNEFKLSVNMWECTSCMVRNKNQDDKCVACYTQKPGNNNTNTASFTNSKVDISSKSPQDTWECDTCWIRNSNAVDRCAACEARKPGLNQVVTAKSGSFGDAFKKKSDEWECGSCMVKNSNDKLKCQCCETPKPGASLPVEKASSLPKFSFGIDKTTANSFTFGIKPEANKSLSSMNSTGGVASSIFGDAAKPIAPSTTTAFVFGINSANQKTDAAKLQPEPKGQVTEKAVKLPILEKADATVASIKDKSVEKVPPVSVSFPFMTNSASTLAKSVDSNIGNKMGSEKPQVMFGFQESKKSESHLSQGFTFGSANSSTSKTESALFSAKPDILKSEISTAVPVNSTSIASVQPVAFGDKPSVVQNNFTDMNNSVKPAPSFCFSPTNKEKLEEKPTLYNASNTNAFSTFGNNIPSQFGTPTAKTFGTPNQPTQEVKPFTFGSTEKVQPSDKPAVFAFGSKPEGFTQTQKADSSNTSMTNFGMGSTQQENSGGFSFGTPKTQPSFVFNSTATFDTGGLLGSNPAVPAQNGGFNFGSSASSSTIKTGFSFGSVSTTNQSANQGVFNFGSANVQSAPSGGFNFGSTSAQFSDNVKPMFNFTSGGPPSSFSAQPGTEGAPQRKLRKAYRRANR